MADAATATRHRQARSKLLAHALLILGVLIFAFPIWIALMGSTHDASTLGRGEVPLLPGPDAVENYATAWTQGGGRMRTTPAWVMLWNSALMALIIAVGKITFGTMPDTSSAISGSSSGCADRWRTSQGWSASRIIPPAT